MVDTHISPSTTPTQTLLRALSILLCQFSARCLFVFLSIFQVRMGDYDLVKESGKRAFLLWRSVYLVKQVSVRTRFLVLFDYLKSEWFGKDTTAL